MGHDDLDAEVYFGQLRGSIQYYRGRVSQSQQVP